MHFSSGIERLFRKSRTDQIVSPIVGKAVGHIEYLIAHPGKTDARFQTLASSGAVKQYRAVAWNLLRILKKALQLPVYGSSDM